MCVVTIFRFCIPLLLSWYTRVQKSGISKGEYHSKCNKSQYTIAYDSQIIHSKIMRVLILSTLLLAYRTCIAIPHFILINAPNDKTSSLTPDRIPLHSLVLWYVSLMVPKSCYCPGLSCIIVQQPIYGHLSRSWFHLIMHDHWYGKLPYYATVADSKTPHKYRSCVRTQIDQTIRYSILA